MGSGNTTSPNGDSAPVRSVTSSLTAWSSGSVVGQPLSTYLVLLATGFILTGLTPVRNVRSWVGPRLISNDRTHPGYPAGVLAGRLAGRPADPAVAAATRPCPAATWQHRRARRARPSAAVGQGRHRRSRLPAIGGAR